MPDEEFTLKITDFYEGINLSIQSSAPQNVLIQEKSVTFDSKTISTQDKIDLLELVSLNQSFAILDYTENFNSFSVQQFYVDPSTSQIQFEHNTKSKIQIRSNDRTSCRSLFIQNDQLAWFGCKEASSILSIYLQEKNSPTLKKQLINAFRDYINFTLLFFNPVLNGQQHQFLFILIEAQNQKEQTIHIFPILNDSDQKQQNTTNLVSEKEIFYELIYRSIDIIKAVYNDEIYVYLQTRQIQLFFFIKNEINKLNLKKFLILDTSHLSTVLDFHIEVENQGTVLIRSIYVVTSEELFHYEQNQTGEGQNTTILKGSYNFYGKKLIAVTKTQVTSSYIIINGKSQELIDEQIILDKFSKIILDNSYLNQGFYGEKSVFIGPNQFKLTRNTNIQQTDLQLESSYFDNDQFITINQKNFPSSTLQIKLDISSKYMDKTAACSSLLINITQIPLSETSKFYSLPLPSQNSGLQFSSNQIKTVASLQEYTGPDLDYQIQNKSQTVNQFINRPSLYQILSDQSVLLEDWKYAKVIITNSEENNIKNTQENQTFSIVSLMQNVILSTAYQLSIVECNKTYSKQINDFTISCQIITKDLFKQFPELQSTKLNLFLFKGKLSFESSKFQYHDFGFSIVENQQTIWTFSENGKYEKRIINFFTNQKLQSLKIIDNKKLIMILEEKEKEDAPVNYYAKIADLVKFEEDSFSINLQKLNLSTEENIEDYTIQQSNHVSKFILKTNKQMYFYQLNPMTLVNQISLENNIKYYFTKNGLIQVNQNATAGELYFQKNILSNKKSLPEPQKQFLQYGNKILTHQLNSGLSSVSTTLGYFYTMAQDTSNKDIFNILIYKSHREHISSLYKIIQLPIQSISETDLSITYFFSSQINIEFQDELILTIGKKVFLISIPITTQVIATDDELQFRKNQIRESVQLGVYQKDKQQKPELFTKNIIILNTFTTTLINKETIARKIRKGIYFSKQQQIQINTREWYQGSFLKMQIACEICNSKIKLQDQIYQNQVQGDFIEIKDLKVINLKQQSLVVVLDQFQLQIMNSKNFVYQKLNFKDQTLSRVDNCFQLISGVNQNSERTSSQPQFMFVICKNSNDNIHYAMTFSYIGLQQTDEYQQQEVLSFTGFKKLQHLKNFQMAQFISQEDSQYLAILDTSFYTSNEHGVQIYSINQDQELSSIPLFSINNVFTKIQSLQTIFFQIMENSPSNLLQIILTSNDNNVNKMVYFVEIQNSKLSQIQSLSIDSLLAISDIQLKHNTYLQLAKLTLVNNKYLLLIAPSNTPMYIFENITVPSSFASIPLKLKINQILINYGDHLHLKNLIFQQNFILTSFYSQPQHKVTIVMYENNPTQKTIKATSMIGGYEVSLDINQQYLYEKIPSLFPVELLQFENNNQEQQQYNTTQMLVTITQDEKQIQFLNFNLSFIQLNKIDQEEFSDQGITIKPISRFQQTDSNEFKTFVSWQNPQDDEDSDDEDDKDPDKPREPRFLEFTYQEYSDCLDKNQPQCSEWDEICQKFQTKLQQTKSQNEQCKYCEQDKNDDLGYGFMPQSCQLCQLQITELQYDSYYNYLLLKHSIPTIQSCAQTGSIAHQQQLYDATIQTVTTCFSKVSRCEPDNVQCNEAQKRQNKCFENSLSCQQGNEELKALQPEEQYPYSMISCHESCAIFIDPEFAKIQDSKFQCFKFRAPTKSTKKFSNSRSLRLLQDQDPYYPFFYSKYEECLQTNLPVCAETDISCQTTIQNFQLKEKSPDCQQCKLEKENPASNGKMPKSCHQCQLYKTQLQRNVTYNYLILQYYIPVQESCSSQGTVTINEKKINVTKTDFFICNEKCNGQCPQSDSSCQISYEAYYDCVTDSPQCQQAEKEFNKTQEDGMVPFSSRVCEESCKNPNITDHFATILRCADKCYTYDSKLDPDYYNFTSQDYENCKSLNVIECSQWITNCEEVLELFQQRNHDDLLCKQCRFDSKNDKAKSRMPVTCSQCINRTTTMEGTDLKFHDQIFSNYLPAIKSCARNGNVQRLQKRDILSTVENYHTCQQNCKKCPPDNINCTSQVELFENCLNQSKQCQNAQQELNNLKSHELYPYSMKACKESCQPYDQGLFFSMLTCWNDCYLYNPAPPAPHPDNEKVSDDGDNSSLVIGLSVGGSCIVIFTLAGFFLYKRYKKKKIELDNLQIQDYGISEEYQGTSNNSIATSLIQQQRNKSISTKHPTIDSQEVREKKNLTEGDKPQNPIQIKKNEIIYNQSDDMELQRKKQQELIQNQQRSSQSIQQQQYQKQQSFQQQQSQQEQQNMQNRKSKMDAHINLTANQTNISEEFENFSDMRIYEHLIDQQFLSHMNTQNQGVPPSNNNNNFKQN